MKHTTTAAAAGVALVLGAAVPGTASANGPGTWTLAYQAPGAGVFSDPAAISRTNIRLEQDGLGIRRACRMNMQAHPRASGKGTAQSAGASLQLPRKS